MLSNSSLHYNYRSRVNSIYGILEEEEKHENVEEHVA